MKFRCTVALAGAAALVACDAGNRDAQNAAPGPTLSIASPRMDETLASGSVELMLDLRHYEIGKVEDGGNGQHVHVIVDDEPYEAIYDASKGIPLGKPGADGKRVLAEGTHVVRAFPSAGPWKKEGDAEHHESRKNPGAFAWVRFHVAKVPDATVDPLRTFDATARPTLTYSRPKGAYAAGTRERDRLLLDFYVTGTTLSKDGHRVKATVDGAEGGITDLGGNAVSGALTEWKAYRIFPTPSPGEHTIVLELLDEDGKPVPGPFNRTERKITIR